MSSAGNITKTHTIIKNVCMAVYALGNGNFWYEPLSIHRNVYKLYSLFVYFDIITFILMEGLAGLFGDYPEDQTNEARLYAVTHILQLVKIYSLYYYRGKIININHDMVKICEAYEKDDVLKRQARKVKRFILTYFGTCYVTAAFVIFSGVHRSLTNGKKINYNNLYYIGY